MKPCGGTHAFPSPTVPRRYEQGEKGRSVISRENAVVPLTFGRAVLLFSLFVSVRPFSSRWFFPLFLSSEGRAPSSGQCSTARARRRSRTPAGRTERRSRRGHRPPRRGGKVRADAPCDARRTGNCLPKRTPSAFPDCGVYGGCGGCRGAAAPLTPCPSPGRRPAARAGQQQRFREEKINIKGGRPAVPLRASPLPRAGEATCRPRRATAAIQGRKNKHQRRETRRPFAGLPPAPRRGGDPPPAPGNNSDSRKKK